ncbi:VPLPA-CTERM sorting domain-containing protein [Pacificoceanicola onchidii]|uniref:VPLPA-CTERM sorting domain-containing protein n=1 Tax=Pacificoceanicola onchidii TaxID=2562685 RepID=UPI0010A4E766|nr:VPLPA-CTERM sorting domain-containing protein [Pacificoceanicola onchidii]
MKSAILTMGLALLAPAAQALTASNFSFAHGTTIGGTTTVDRVGVTLTTTGFAAHGTTSIWNGPTAANEWATVSFTFDTAITEFTIDVSYINLGEYIDRFTIDGVTRSSIADPDSVTGDLSGPGLLGVSTTRRDDLGAGTMIWTGSSFTSLSFEVLYTSGDGTYFPGALLLNSFALTNAIPAPPPDPEHTAPVPLPASAGLLFAGLGGLAALRRRKRG